MRDTGNAVDAADDDQAGEYCQSNADSHRRNIESQIHGRSDGVGLGRVTDETQRDNQGDGEKAGQETRRATADFRGQAVRDVKRRAADVFSVADHAVFLRQNGFCKMVDMPRMADNHIQKMAPGPPAVIAVATPATLPVPICAEIATASA